MHDAGLRAAATQSGTRGRRAGRGCLLPGILIACALCPAPADAQGWRCGGHTIEWVGGFAGFGGGPAGDRHAAGGESDRGRDPAHEDGSQPAVPEPSGLNRQRWDDLVFNAYDLPRSRPPFIEALARRQTQVIERDIVPTIGICVQGSEHSYAGRRFEPYANETWWREQIERWSGLRWSGELRVDACTNEPPDGWIYVREAAPGSFGSPALAQAINRQESHPHGRGRWLASELIWNPDVLDDDIDEEYFEVSLAHELGHALGFFHAAAGTGYVMEVGTTPSRPWPEEESSLTQLAYRVGPNVRYPGLVREEADDGDPNHPDRPALTALHDGTGGRDWTDSSNWGTDAPLHRWHGVATGSDGRVNELDLHANNLAGAIPPDLGDLAGLEYLNLEDNPLTGPIPRELGGLANLSRLELNRNGLTGSIPAELGNLSRLEVLNIGDTDLSGSIPAELGRLSNLQHLSISDAGVSGPIPAELGGMSSLLTLSFHALELTGSIPPELGNLSSMWQLWLAGNNLTGSVPPELARASSLRNLVLRDNNLSGPLPASLTELRELSYLDIQDNDGLCAPADAAFQAWLATVSSFRGPTCAADPVPALPLPGMVAGLLLLGGLGARAIRRLRRGQRTGRAV